MIIILFPTFKQSKINDLCTSIAWLHTTLCVYVCTCRTYTKIAKHIFINRLCVLSSNFEIHWERIETQTFNIRR